MKTGTGLFRYRRVICVRTFGEVLECNPSLSEYGFREATCLDTPAIGQIHYRLPAVAWLTYLVWRKRSYGKGYGKFTVMYGIIDKDGNWKITNR